MIALMCRFLLRILTSRTDVKTILCLNRNELLQFLPSFLSDKSEVIQCS